MASLPSRKWAFRISLAVTLTAVAGAIGWWWDRTSRPEYRFERGRDAIRRGDWETAYAIAARLESEGESDRALLLSGEAHMERGRFADALKSLNLIEARGALRFRAAVLSARCLLELKRLREAHRVYMWILEQDPSDVDVHRGLGAIAYDLGQLHQAVKHLEKVAQLDPADGRPHRLIGLIGKDLGQFGDAETAYEEALRRDLPPALRLEARRELAEVLLKQLHYAESLAALDRLGEPPQPGDIAIRAEALVGLGQREEARSALESATKAHPEEASLQSLFGRLDLDEGRIGQAIEHLEAAVRLAPTDDVAGYRLGLAYSAAGRPADAERQQRRVESLRADLKRLTDLSRDADEKPWDAEVRRQLAALCERMGKPQLAAMWEAAGRACGGR